MVDVQSLPVRLRESFVTRPWPNYDLENKVVDWHYIPRMPRLDSPEAWTLEITDDERIRIGGDTKPITGNALMLLNIMLLTRDWHLRGNDVISLGFGSYIVNQGKRTSLLETTRTRLRAKVAPYGIFADPNREHSGTDRLNPAMHIVDWRMIRRVVG